MNNNQNSQEKENPYNSTILQALLDCRSCVKNTDDFATVAAMIDLINRDDDLRQRTDDLYRHHAYAKASFTRLPTINKTVAWDELLSTPDGRNAYILLGQMCRTGRYYCQMSSRDACRILRTTSNKVVLAAIHLLIDNGCIAVYRAQAGRTPPAYMINPEIIGCGKIEDEKTRVREFAQLCTPEAAAQFKRLSDDTNRKVQIADCTYVQKTTVQKNLQNNEASGTISDVLNDKPMYVKVAMIKDYDPSAMEQIERDAKRQREQEMDRHIRSIRANKKSPVPADDFSCNSSSLPFDNTNCPGTSYHNPDEGARFDFYAEEAEDAINNAFGGDDGDDN